MATAIRERCRCLPVLLWIAALLAIGSGQARAQLSQLPVNLDGISGAESTLSLELLSSSPTNQVRLKIINGATGQSHGFNWYNGGPGGFSSSVAGESCGGTTIRWDWSTTRVIYSYTGITCDSSSCFYRNAMPVVTLGPFAAPGRSLSASGVTLSSASLASSLLTFFAPTLLVASCNQPKEITRVTGTVAQLTAGDFRYRTRVLNLSQSPIVYDLQSRPPCTCTTIPCTECAFTGVVLPPGGAKEYCQVSPHPAQEESNGYTLCGLAIPDGPDADLTAGTPAVRCSTGDPATKGPFNMLVPDKTRVIGNDPFLTPLKILVTDPDGNGIVEPGEKVSLRIFLLNAGPVALTDVTATLSSPPIDLTDDGTVDPVAVDIVSGSPFVFPAAPVAGVRPATANGKSGPVRAQDPLSPGLEATSAYPDIPGTPATSASPGNCATALAEQNPVENVSAFVVGFPPNHPTSVGRPFNLHVIGTAPGHPPGSFEMDVPFVLAVGAHCTPP